MLSHPNRVSNLFCFTTELYHCVRLTYSIPFYDVSLQRGVSLTTTASYIGVSAYLDVGPQKEYQEYQEYQVSQPPPFFRVVFKSARPPLGRARAQPSQPPPFFRVAFFFQAQTFASAGKVSRRSSALISVIRP